MKRTNTGRNVVILAGIAFVIIAAAVFVVLGSGSFGDMSAPTSTSKPAYTPAPTDTAAVASEPTQIFPTPTREGLIQPTELAAVTNSDTPQSTATPNLTASALANGLDGQATSLAQTATAPPADLTPETSKTPLTLTLITTQPVIINDSAGRVIGDGEIRVYAPAAMNFGDTGEIQVQIEANPQSNGGATLNPQPSPTPALSTPRATPTPLILVDNGRQFITVYEYMNATLRGVHLGNFRVDAIPPNGIRHLTGSGTIYWWKWSISPKKEAVGIDNALEIYIVPQSSSANTPIDSQARTISFKVKVNDVGGSTSNTIMVAVIVLVLIVIALVIGFVLLRTRGSHDRQVPNTHKWGKNRVFISYRRDDSLEVVGRIYDRLVQHFGRQTIFKDMDSIQAGVDFREALNESVGRADVLLAVIGDRWLSIAGTDGKRRLDNPQDFVRLEIETALQREIVVIPLLVRNARIPEASDLPASLGQLAYRNAIPIRSDPDFNNDMERLIKALDGALTDANTKAKRP
jgi:hypothetical protein